MSFLHYLIYYYFNNVNWFNIGMVMGSNLGRPTLNFLFAGIMLA